MGHVKRGTAEKNTSAKVSQCSICLPLLMGSFRRDYFIMSSANPNGDVNCPPGPVGVRSNEEALSVRFGQQRQKMPAGSSLVSIMPL